MLKLRTGIADLVPYTLEVRADYKFDANELPYELPESIIARIIEKILATALNRYPEDKTSNLRKQLADNNAVQVENVVLGNGSSQLLQTICYAFGGAGRKIIYISPSFSMYPIYIKLADSIGVAVEMEEDFSVCTAKIISSAKKDKAGLIILCNPNNPTGGTIALDKIEKIVQHVNCPVVVDEAYFEFFGQTALKLLKNYSNIIVVRTFSKAYGLAAARVGYLFAEAKIAEAVRKALLPYSINGLSIATAEAVYELRDQISDLAIKVIAEREEVSNALQKISDITVYSSETNFLLIKTTDADSLATYLSNYNIAVRKFPASSELGDCLRITIGTPLENQILIKYINSFYSEVQNKCVKE